MLSNFSNSVACSSGQTRIVLVTFEVAAETERVIVSNPRDVVCDTERLLLALIERSRLDHQTKTAKGFVPAGR